MCLFIDYKLYKHTHTLGSEIISILAEDGFLVFKNKKHPIFAKEEHLLFGEEGFKN